ncbi:unnamed protein product, partial [Ilex paraguariensis]
MYTRFLPSKSFVALVIDFVMAISVDEPYYRSHSSGDSWFKSMSSFNLVKLLKGPAPIGIFVIGSLEYCIKPNPGSVPRPNSMLSPLPPERADYDRGATVDIPLDSSKDLRMKKELQAKEAELKRREQKFHRDLPLTPVFAYGTSKNTATIPGPTIEAINGVDTYVTWQNHLPSKHILPWDPTIPTAIPSTKKGIPTVVHLHGAIGEAESDGHAESWFTVGFKERGRTWSKKMYHYHNFQQPGTMWYHDHAMGLTRVNILAGLSGAYIIRQPNVEAPLGLPHGDEFERPLVIFDRSFRTDGSIYMNSTGNNPSIHPQWQPEYFGDAVIVNGKAWPHMIVKRRKYRFRIINASNARFFKFFFTNGLDFIHVGSDSAYHERPVIIDEILMAPSEIADVIVDFSKSKSDSAILANDAPYPFPTGDPVNKANGKVMKFIVEPHHVNDKSRVPHKLLEYPSPDVSSASLTRYIAMYEYTSPTGEPTHLYLNGMSFEKPVTETPK